MMLEGRSAVNNDLKTDIQGLIRKTIPFVGRISELMKSVGY
jgi:hypothetical protein